MARIQRVLRLQELLRGRDATSVEELARVLKVSARTVHRDLATLRSEGQPIRGDPGRGGGIRLERGSNLVGVHLSENEVVALWLAARMASLASTLPWSHGARSGLDKLFASVPRERARRARALCRRVVVGAPATPRVLAELGKPPAELMALFERAFSEGVGLAFHYRDRHGKESRRRIEPHGLKVEPPVWYVFARDIDLGEPRVFRMDRISRPELLPGHTFVPEVESLARERAALEARAATAPSGKRSGPASRRR